LSLAFGVWFFGDKMIKGIVPALVMSYAGLLLIFAWNLTVNPDGLWVGTGLILTAAVTYALYLHLAKRQMGHVGPTLFTSVAMGAASIVSITHNTVLHGAGQYFTLSSTVWLCGLALGLLGTVAPSFVLNHAISRIGARAAASTGAYGPIVTIILAVLILDEHFTIIHAIGAALVVAGSLWFGRAEARAKG
jgi:drug/metabolite transporter (DMT)-like permease